MGDQPIARPVLTHYRTTAKAAISLSKITNQSYVHEAIISRTKFGQGLLPYGLVFFISPPVRNEEITIYKTKILPVDLYG
jgi:hypothetical protein